MSEELFPPTPGGMVDTHRKQQAADQEQMNQAAASVLPEITDYAPVKVDVIAPEIFTARTLVVSTTGTAAFPVLPFDMNRKRAVIMTLDEPIVVANSASTADDSRNATNTAGQSAGGFVLPVNVALEIDSRAEIWVAATSSTATRVSILSEQYAGV